MPAEGLIDSLTSTTTTRRTIVKTGTKLAYAAPLVAATLSLSAAAAGAASPVEACGGGTDACSSSLNCAGGTCYCNTNVGGGTSCNGLGTCASCAVDGDCTAVTGAGSHCVLGGSCCGDGTACVAACPDAGGESRSGPQLGSAA
jgi:hypothetical protein